jgi:peptidyl-prolyl cis-trans isomerase SurA
MRIRRLFGSAVLALVATACAATFTTGAAIVDGTRISEAELDAAVTSRLGGQQVDGEQRAGVEREALAELISLILTRRLAADRGVTVSEERLQRELADVRSRFPDEAEFLRRVEEAGFTLESLTERFRDELLREELSSSLAPQVDPAEVRAAYNAQIDQYRQVMVRHILFTVDQATTEAQAKAKADAALARIRKGESFAKLATTLSDDTSTAAEGGALPGWTSLAGLDQSFAKAAFDAKINTPTEPVRSQFGYHLILTTKKRTRPLAEVAPEITTGLQAQAGQAILREELQALSARARVAVNPKYGDWDPESATVVPHSSYVPAEPEESPDPAGLPPGILPGG